MVEIVLPAGVADHDDGIAAGNLAFLGQKTTAERGLDAQSLEVILAGKDPKAHLGLGGSRSGDAVGTNLAGDHAVKRVGFVAQVAVVGIGDAAERIVWRVGIDGDDGSGFEDGQRAEQDGVGETEDAAIGADTQREGEDGNEGEARILEKNACSEADVVKKGEQELSSIAALEPDALATAPRLPARASAKPLAMRTLAPEVGAPGCRLSEIGTVLS
jgi:hypothetical protein